MAQLANLGADKLVTVPIDLETALDEGCSKVMVQLSSVDSTWM